MEYSGVANPAGSWLDLFIVKLAIAFVLAYVGRYVAIYIRGLLKDLLIKRKVDLTVANFAANATCVACIIFVVMAALEYAGVNTSSLLAMVGAAGLAVGLALQGSLSNLASGVLLVLFRPFKVGDFIDAAGVLGTVQEVQLFYTRLTSPDNKLIIVPNSKLTADNITNISGKTERRVDLIFSISYSDNIGDAKAAIEAVLKAEPRILPEPEPFIGVGELGASSVDIVVRPWVKTPDWWPVRTTLLEKIKLALEDAGCTIPFPQRDVHIYQEK
jgi:small conductance mechanosensitive channel